MRRHARFSHPASKMNGGYQRHATGSKITLRNNERSPVALLARTYSTHNDASPIPYEFLWESCVTKVLSSRYFGILLRIGRSSLRITPSVHAKLFHHARLMSAALEPSKDLRILADPKQNLSSCLHDFLSACLNGWQSRQRPFGL